MTASLPRRAFLGIELPEGDPFTPEGMRAAGAAAGSMAHEASIEAGDVVVRLADAPLRSFDELRVAIGRAGEMESARIVVVRGGERFERFVRVQHRPPETMAGHEVRFDHVDARGARLRTIVTRPLDARRHAAVLVIQGLSCESIDFSASHEAPLCRLIQGWAREGFVTMRVEKRGVGDSEGERPDRTDFATEVDDVRAALRVLASYDFVDRDAVVVFGHSVGGMIAPLLESERIARGYVVYGTSAARWLACVDASTRRQLELRGASPDVIDERARRGQDDLRSHAVTDGRSAEYHRQLDATDVAAAWSRVDHPVLVLHGEHDWVVSDDEGLRVAGIVNARHPGAATFERVRGLDHLMTRHDSLTDSLRAYGGGAKDDQVARVSADWMRRATSV